MGKDEKTILDAAETICDAEETILDPEVSAATLPDDGAATPDGATVLDDETSPHDGSTPPPIEKGSFLLDTYRVESDAIEGGMGAVWRVHHTGWNVDLAVKRPKAGMFQTEEQKETFIRECNAWINLGLHPHIVSGYYVREIGKVPSIFSEWMDGGSLKNAIEDGRLYEGNAAERILDIAIQFARGLRYAHEQGLIHQDVKPDNLLLTKDFEAKTADFGIARARSTLSVPGAESPTDATRFSANGGYTPAYCSPEQRRGDPLTLRTDLYSWAVSVMEMYLGDRPWQNGVVAGAACEEYFPEAKIAIPQRMRDLLKECMTSKEAERPHDFAAVEARLLEIYREETRNNYSRPASKAAVDTAESLNNRALSMLDLGKPEEAEALWERALEWDDRHKESNYNKLLYRLQNGKLRDHTALTKMLSLYGDQAAITPDSLAAQLLLRSRCCPSIGQPVALKQDELLPPEQAYDRLALSVIETRRSPDASAFLADGRVIFVENNEKRITISETKDGKTVQRAFSDNAKSLYGCKELLFSHIGKMIVVVSNDGIDLFSSDTGAFLRSFSDPGAPENASLTGCALSADGRLLATTTWKYRAGARLCVWDICGSPEMLYAKEMVQPIGPLCFSPDRGRIYVDADRRVYAVRTENGEILREYALEMDPKYMACLSGTNEVSLLTARGELYRLDPCSGSVRQFLWADGDKDITAAAFSADGKKLLYANAFSPEDETCFLEYIDVQRGRSIHSFAAHHGVVTHISMTGDGSRAVSSGCDRTVKTWMLPDPQAEPPLQLSVIKTSKERIEQDEVLHEALRRIDDAVQTCDYPSAIREIGLLRSLPGFSYTPDYYRLSDEIGKRCVPETLRLIPHATLKGKISETVFTDPTTIAAAAEEGVILFDARNGQRIGVIDYIGDNRSDEPAGQRRLCAAAQKRLYLAEGSNLRVFDVQTQKLLASAVTNEPVEYLSTGLCGDKLALTTYEYGKKNLYLYDGKTLRLLSKYKTGYELIIGILMDPAEKKVLVLPQTEPAATLFLDNKGLVRHQYAPGGSSWGTGILCPHDSTGAALVLRDGRVIYDLFYPFREWPDQWKILLDHSTDTDCQIEQISVTPNGRFVACGCGGKQKFAIELYDLTEKKKIGTYDRISSLPNSKWKGILSSAVMFSPDGLFLTSAVDESQVLVWRVDYDYSFPGFATWDEGARPYLEIFLTLHPAWTQADFSGLLIELQTRGYGWLKPEGVREKLLEMQPKKKGLFGRVKR